MELKVRLKFDFDPRGSCKILTQSKILMGKLEHQKLNLSLRYLNYDQHRFYKGGTKTH
jgi:hypothetical protein